MHRGRYKSFHLFVKAIKLYSYRALWSRPTSKCCPLVVKYGTELSSESMLTADMIGHRTVLNRGGLVLWLSQEFSIFSKLFEYNAWIECLWLLDCISYGSEFVGILNRML